MFQNSHTGQAMAHSPCSKVMDQPGRLVGVHHGDMSVHPAIFFVYKMPRYIGMVLVQFSICFFKNITIGFDIFVFFAVYKSGIKKEFPQSVHFYFTGNPSITIIGYSKNMVEMSERFKIHIGNCQTALYHICLLYTSDAADEE